MYIYKNVISVWEKIKLFALWGALGGGVGSLVGEIEILGTHKSSLIVKIFEVGIWFGIIGSLISVSLLIASFQYSNKGIQLKQALAKGLWIGFLAGAIAGAISQCIFAILGSTEFLRIICWAIAGGLLGFGLSFRIPNLGKSRGLGGGLVGGFLGCILFDLVGMSLGVAAEAGARLVGIAAIGLCIGIMIVVAETVFREAWLEISYNSREKRTVTLGAEPISIGSNSQLCSVFVPNFAPVVYRYLLKDGSIVCQDIVSNTTLYLEPGASQLLGGVTIKVCGEASTFSNSNIAQESYVSSAKFSLSINYKTVPLRDKDFLTNKEIPGLESHNNNGIVAEVNQNPQDPNILGLKNLSYSSWVATLVTGEQRQIDSGRSVKLAAGTKINFGPIMGEII